MLNFNWGAIGPESVVAIAVSEYRSKGQPIFTGESQPRFVGAASIRVENISPHGPPTDPNNGVTFAVNIDWEMALPIVTDITVFEERPSEVQYMKGSIDR